MYDSRPWASIIPPDTLYYFHWWITVPWQIELARLNKPTGALLMIWPYGKWGYFQSISFGNKDILFSVGSGYVRIFHKPTFTFIP